MRPLLLLALVVLAGCPQSTEELRRMAAQPPSAPPVPEWKDDVLSFRGVRGDVRFTLRGTRLQVHCSQLPPNTSVAIGADKTAVDSGGGATLTVDLGPVLAKLPPRDAFDWQHKFDPKVKVDFDFGGPAKVSVDAPKVSAGFALKDAFSAAANAPLALPQPEAPPAEHTIVWLGTSVETFGPATTLDAVDWVAVAEKLPKRAGKTCGGYKKSGSDEPAKSYTLQLVDEKVVVYDVRTSKEVASREFAATGTCPMLAFGDEATSYASDSDIKAWLREARKGKDDAPVAAPKGKQKRGK